MKVVRSHLVKTDIEQWAKVQRTDEGDTMLASDLAACTGDKRDASFVRVCLGSPPLQHAFSFL
jgi:hypothetical protein